LGEKVHNVSENAETLMVASKETGVEVNVKKLSTWSCLVIGMEDEITK